MRVNQGMVRTRGVCVGGNRFRHVRCSCLEQSLNSKSVLHVVGRKVLSPENSLRLDVVGFQDVTQENRDVARVVAREVLTALDGRATRGAGLGANKAASIATSWATAIITTGLATAISFARRTANFASTMVLDEGKIQVFALSTASITVCYETRSEALGEARRVARRTDCRTSSIERSPMKFRVW